MDEEIKDKERNYEVTLHFKLSSKTVEQGLERVREALEFMGLKVIKVKNLSGARTLRQNAAAHLWFDQMEEEAEKKGITMDILVLNPTEVPVTAELLKDLFRLIAKKMYGKDSTAILKKDEFSEVVKYFDKTVLERTGINVPFPSIELLMDKDYEQK